MNRILVLAAALGLSGSLAATPLCSTTVHATFSNLGDISTQPQAAVIGSEEGDIRTDYDLMAPPAKTAFAPALDIDASQPVPEPITAILLGAGLMGIGLIKVRKKK